jgi:two-component system sensor histidine kinase AtoS
MKKHVLFGLALMLCCFITGGIYIVSSIQSVTQKLEQAVAFHQVEFLRLNLLHHIKAVQSNLLLQGSPHSRSHDDSILLIEALEESADVCLNCHHSVQTRNRLKGLEESTEEYMKLLSRTLTLRASKERLENARVLAFNKGEKLQKTVLSLSIASADKISVRIKKIHSDINTTKYFLMTCLVLGPLAIFLITIIFLRRFTGSIDTLIHATKTLESGDLDYRIEDTLKDEFRTLANAFNGMALALKNEQKNFKSAQALYQTLFESAGDAIIIAGLDNENFAIILSANKAASKLYGYSNKELVGMAIDKLVPDNESKKLRARIRTVFSEEWTLLTTRARKKNGTLMHVDLSMGVLEFGEVKHLLSFSRDITDLFEAEEKQHHVNQMTLVGQMAAGLAHEIKNPLAGVKVSLEVMAEDLVLQEEDQEIFVRIVNEVNRMEKLLKNLLNYARPPQPQFDIVDINRLLTNSLKNAEIACSARANFVVHFENTFATNMPQVEIDSFQMQQVFLNIYLNAIDAIEVEGSISTGTRVVDGENIWIEISDSGKGMSKPALEKIFNPFFTTKAKGTGLGLSICRRLIEQHNGSITIDSHVDVGTSIIIILPLKNIR